MITTILSHHLIFSPALLFPISSNLELEVGPWYEAADMALYRCSELVNYRPAPYSFFFVILSMSSWLFFSFPEGTEFRKPVQVFVFTKSKDVEAAEHLVPGPAGKKKHANHPRVSSVSSWSYFSFTEGTEFRKPVSVFFFTKLKVSDVAEHLVPKRKNADHLRRVLLLVVYCDFARDIRVNLLTSCLKPDRMLNTINHCNLLTVWQRALGHSIHRFPELCPFRERGKGSRTHG